MNQMIINGKIIEEVNDIEDNNTMILRVKNIEYFGSIPRISTISISLSGSLKTYAESELSIGDNVLAVGRFRAYTTRQHGAIVHRSIIVATSLTKEEFKQYE